MGISLQFLIRRPLPDQPVIGEPGLREFHTQPQVHGFQDHPLKREEKAVPSRLGLIEVYPLSQTR